MTVDAAVVLKRLVLHCWELSPHLPEAVGKRGLLSMSAVNYAADVAGA